MTSALPDLTPVDPHLAAHNNERHVLNGKASINYNAAVASVGPAFAADTYLAGSNVAPAANVLKAGTFYRCRMHVIKTAAGLATPIITIRMGTLATVADAAIVTLTFAAQTAVADDGFIEVFATFRSVGAGTSAVVAAVGVLDHSLAATGLSTANTSIKSAISAGFDSTPVRAIGLSLNAGASAAWTVDFVTTELQNLA